MTAFTDQMDKLAAEIAAASCDVEGSNVARVPLGDKIDAFKALMPYYALLMKKQDDKPDEDDLPNFDNFTANIHASENDHGSDEPGVRGSRRNGN
jgi:hypothetical protein